MEILNTLTKKQLIKLIVYLWKYARSVNYNSINYAIKESENEI
jgi:hypothetical protein